MASARWYERNYPRTPRYIPRSPRVRKPASSIAERWLVWRDHPTASGIAPHRLMAALGEQLRREALSFGDTLDLDRGRVHSLLEAAEALRNLVERRGVSVADGAAPVQRGEDDLRDAAQGGHQPGEDEKFFDEHAQ